MDLQIMQHLLLVASSYLSIIANTIATSKKFSLCILTNFKSLLEYYSV